jgi:acetyl-CoA/propionyl-CoA carboxylase, biotin carboxylase, biotin carboxyl carrier protein
MFDTVLIANRGEIAVRIIRTLQRLGVRSAAVYSDADRTAPHVLAADVAVHIGAAPAVDSYLRIDRVVAAALEVGADAVHPGYGFLSENAAFARACADADLVFIGPPPTAIETMGDKITARRTVAAAGVRVVPGCDERGLSDAQLRNAAGEIGVPVLIKPSAGGGGKGMRVVRDLDDFDHAVVSARREAAAAFGDDTLFVERFVDSPRHVEVQVLFDAHGAAVHLGERECSLQRRHQKIVEEAPSPLLTPPQRAAMGEQALAASRACGYVNAGTVEFIVSANRPDEPYFMEMNTRLQVEHPVTEMVWGLDIVEQQLLVAAGQPLSFRQADLQPSGHAVEARIYAEDPANAFMPSPGRVVALELAGPANSDADGHGVRVDAGVAHGDVITVHYDPMIAKVVAHGADRPAALARLDHALGRSRVAGVATNIGFLRRLLADPDVVAGRLDTGLVERRLDALAGGTPPADVVVAAALAVAAERSAGLDAADPWNRRDGWRLTGPAPVTWRATVGDREVVVSVAGDLASATVIEGGASPVRVTASFAAGVLDATIAGRRVRAHIDRAGRSLWVTIDGESWCFTEPDLTAAAHGSVTDTSGTLRSPMPGVVVAVSVVAGAAVADGAPVVSVEAMKMEHTLRAPFAGTVTEVLVEPGRRVELGAPLVVIEPELDGNHSGDLADVRGGAQDNDVQDTDGQEAT